MISMPCKKCWSRIKHEELRDVFPVLFVVRAMVLMIVKNMFDEVDKHKST